MSVSYETILADLDPRAWRGKMLRQYQYQEEGKSASGQPCKPGQTPEATG